MKGRKLTVRVDITLRPDSKPTLAALKGYIKEALLAYSGCFDPEEDPLFYAIKRVTLGPMDEVKR